jgi:4-amino-4-deoxy-L-arabinose transferase-like glycosyltransferase
MSFPPAFVDEGWFASRAWAFIHTGRAFGSLDAGVFDRFEGYWTFFPWLPTLLQSLGLRLFGAPDLFPMRMTSLVFGLLLLGAVYAIANRLRGWKFGLLSVFLVSVSWSFSYSAHLARIDVIAAAFGFAAIALHLNNRSSYWWMSLLSGLCVGLAFEIHPHSAIYGPAIVALYFLDRRCWSMVREPCLWSFVAGVSIGLAFYAALHILPYPQTYLMLNRLAFGPTHTPPLLEPRHVFSSTVDMGRLLFLLYPLLVPLIIWAIVVLLREHSKSAKTLVVLSGVLVGAGVLLMRNKAPYYAILFTPAIDLVIAALVLEVGQRPWQGRLGDYVRRGLAWGICFGTAVLNLVLLLRYDFGEVYRTVQSRVNQSIQPGESIMASQTYWFGLYDHVYYSWEELVYYRRYAPDSTLEDAFREFRPDVLIVDESWDCFVTDRPGDSPYLQHLTLPRTAMESFLSRYAYLVDEFDGGCFGPVRVYRIAWER